MLRNCLLMVMIELPTDFSYALQLQVTETGMECATRITGSTVIVHCLG